MSHEGPSPAPASQRQPEAITARVVALVVLAHLLMVAAMFGLMSWVNSPLAGAVGSWVGSMGASASDVARAKTYVSLALTFVEFMALAWLVYDVFLLRVWPEAKRRRAAGEDKWTKEEIIILLLFVLIMLEIFD